MAKSATTFTAQGLKAPPLTERDAQLHIHLNDADLDRWRDEVLSTPSVTVTIPGRAAATGDTALNDAAVDLIDWQPEPAQRSSLPVFVVFMTCMGLYFGSHLVAYVARVLS